MLMGDHKKYILNRLAELTGVDIFCQADETLSSYQRNSELNPIFRNSQLRERLMKEAAAQKLPLLHKEKILKRFQFSEVMDIAQIMDAVLNENTTEDMADRPEGTALCTEHSVGSLSEAAFHRGKWSWCYGQAGAGC